MGYHSTMENLPISVGEFLKSDNLSKVVISLRDEDVETDGGDESVSSELQVLKNAARVALLVTQSFVNLCCVSKISHNETRHHLSSIDLDDFFVNLDETSYNYSGAAAPITYDQNDGPSDGRAIETCDDFYEYFNELISEEEEKKNSAVRDRNGKELGLGYFSFNPEPFGKSTGSDDQGIILTDNKSLDPKKRSSQGASCWNADKNGKVILYGTDILFPTRMADEEQQHLQHAMATPMKILGKLLYSVFSRGDHPPSDIFTTRADTSSQDMTDFDEAEDILEQFSKFVRGPKTSVFSKLVESQAFPISICRIISDLLEYGSIMDNPFNSFGDVIEELQQVISQPGLFLCDSKSSHAVQHVPVFGHVYYGRDEEIDKIVKVASHMKQSAQEAGVGVEAIFVKGIAGSGKSQLVQTASDNLSKSGCTLMKAKFERGAEHASRSIISSMFDEVVLHLVKLKKGGCLSEITKCDRASELILENLGSDGLSAMVDFLPSLPLLFEDNIDNQQRMHTEDWQLIYGLVVILEAVLASYPMCVLCCDDLQWADRTTLALVTEVLTKLGENLGRSNRCCLFIGMYREDEVDDDHPFSIQYSYLQMSSCIHTTEVTLSSLSKNDVQNMISAELKLPQRRIKQLANVVYKRTSGNAFFVVQLLNNLVRNKVIDYSLRDRCYSWDQDRISLLQTGESVAELIASNIKTLPEESQQVLWMLSLFGIQTDISLLTIMEGFQEGIISSLDAFIEQGILDQAGPIIIFTHDLIQQAAYESMPTSQRQTLHLQIGEFLGGLANIPSSGTLDPVTSSMNQLQLNDQTFYVGNTMASSLISIACDQIDSAGTDLGDDDQRLKFAEWNLCSGQKASHQSDWRAAQFYYTKGIEFLGKECWLNDFRLCLALHEGVVFASFALSEANQVVKYAQKCIKHVSFEDTMKIQPLLLRSLSNTGKHNECITRGVSILRRLDFDIPLSPTMEIVINSMASTNTIASRYSFDEIMHCCDMSVQESAQNIVRIMDAFYLSCYATSSPFLPLISCELLKYSLQHGICSEATVAFASFGMFRIFFNSDYAGGKRWADIVRAITRKLQSLNKVNRRNFDIRAHILLYITIDIWFSSPRDVSKKLLKYHHHAKKLGQVDTAMIALQMGWRYLLYSGGENLSIMLQSTEERVELIAKNSDYAIKYIALDNALLQDLTGESLDHLSSIEGMVCNIEDIKAEAESTNNNRLLHHIHFNNAMLAYWRGDYDDAEKSSIVAWKYPTAKMPTIVLIYHSFFDGLIAFHQYRKIDCDERLQRGKEMMNRMGMWSQNAIDVFQSKWLLLQSEHAFSVGEHQKAKGLYEASIKSAKDNGNINELGLAYELFGSFCMANKCGVDANTCFRKAHTSYIQWGAKAVADRVVRSHQLDLSAKIDEQELHAGNTKRSR